MEALMVKLWIKNEINKIRNHYQENDEVGLAKIDVLEKFYDAFELDNVNVKITYHEKVQS
jgi:hypothetical protein